jgi:hypothetical protein
MPEYSVWASDLSTTVQPNILTMFMTEFSDIDDDFQDDLG